MSGFKFRVIDSSPISIQDYLFLDIDFVLNAVQHVNSKFRQLKLKTESMALNVFEAIDFRMMSGLVGESLVSTISASHPHLEKNPNIDGYPDLLNASMPQYRRDIAHWKKDYFKAFIKYPYSGIEIKNTFGTKKAKSNIAMGHTRIGRINNKLDWKAHHRYTNNLLALFSDYIDECPQIVAVMYSDDLVEDDWKEKQNPKKNSTMTSFSVIDKSGWEKLKSEIKLCIDDKRYLSFFGLEGA